MKNINITNFPALSYSGSEGFNTLCTNLSFSGENVKRILVTSSHAYEGKSFVSMNIMRTLARLGKRVAFVDADLRRSVNASNFGFRCDGEGKMLGLSHLLAGMAREDDVIYTTDIENTTYVPVGKTVTNSLPLLNSPRLPDLLDRLSEDNDYIIIDAPPAGQLVDASQIAKFCDGILFVVSYNNVRRQELVDNVAQLRATGCQILGTVINGAEYESFVGRKYYYRSYYYRRYGYYYQYGSESGKGKKPKKNK